MFQTITSQKKCRLSKKKKWLHFKLFFKNYTQKKMREETAQETTNGRHVFHASASGWLILLNQRGKAEVANQITSVGCILVLWFESRKRAI